MNKLTKWSLFLTLSFLLTLSPTCPAMAQPYPGFSLALFEGVFWDFQWDYDYDYVSSFGPDSEQDSGTFRVRLGSPILINGITAYEVQVTGKSKAAGSTELGPRWRYLASVNNQILGSTDGATLVILFDGQTGRWPGSGLFSAYSSNKLFVAQASQISNNYINEPAIAVSQSSSSSQCEYFPGVGTICGGDYSTSDIKTEYYKGGIGPVGHYKYFAISDMTNQYWWSSTTTIHVGLVASSLRGDKVFHVFEKEPNDFPAGAQIAIIGGGIKGFASDTDQGTLMTLSQTAEIEPNDHPQQTGQALTLPTLINGDIKEDDGATVINFQYGGQTWQRRIEDWYTFTLTSQTRVQVELNHQGPTGAEIQLYLFRDTGTTSMGQMWCFEEIQSPTTTVRSVDCVLDAGKYLIAVDDWDAGGARKGYTLDVLNGKRSTEDFYSFTVITPGTVILELNHENSSASFDLYLFDAGANNLLGSDSGPGQQGRIEINLNPGAYVVGVDAHQGSSNYTLTIKDTTFCDVLKDNWAYGYVEAIYNSGITGGCSQDPLLFCPDQSVTRGQMAVFIEAFLGNPANTCSSRFSDVPSGPFCGFIERMADDGITSGCGGVRFCPNDPVTRGQMAVFIEGALGHTANVCQGRFTDVPSGPFCGFIERMADDGITSGCGSGRFCPNDPVTRAQMAVFLMAAPPPVIP